MPRDALGRMGEAAAARAAAARGYEVVGRNVRLSGGEIDLIALDGGTVVFVEVKARAGAAHGSGASAVTAAKMRHLARAALAFLRQRRWTNRPCRGDVCVIGWAPPVDDPAAPDTLTVDWRKGVMPLGDYVRC